MKKINISQFVLKIIAIVTMTFDHVGVFLMDIPSTHTIGYIFRAIGRIAFPLFALMLVEGALHTRDWKKYLLRLVIIMIPIIIAQIVMDYGFKYKLYQGNIFIDLSLGLLMIVCFENKKKTIKLLGILPILYGILSYVCFYLEYKYSYQNLVINWFPYYLRCQYYFMSMFFIALIYFAYKLFIPMMYRFYNLEPSLHEESENCRFIRNVCVSLLLVIFCAIGILLQHFRLVCWNVGLQSYMLLAIVPILLYNGKRGYNAKWFRIFSYLYYPVHLVIIAAIFFVIL